MDRHLTILGCVGAYLAFCIGIGIWALRRTRTPSEFFVAGRSLGAFVTAMAVFSSTVSGFAFVGGPGFVYRLGMSSMWMVICQVMAVSITFWLLAKRLRLMAEVRDAISIPEVVAARYGSESVRFTTATAILFGVVGYLAAQILAMSVVLRVLMIGAGWFPEVTLGACVAFSTAVLVFYCVTGGILASVYTDVVQGVVMVAASLLVFFTARDAFDGGFEGMSRVLAADDPEAIGPFGTTGILACLSWLFVFAAGTCGQPHVVSKLMMTRHPRDARLILPVTAVAGALAALLWLAMGMVMRALVIDGTQAPLAHSEDAAAEFLQGYANPALAGLVFAGLMAAIMSTADSFLNIGAAAIVHDVPRALRGRSLRRELLWARVATVALAVIAAVLAVESRDVVGRLAAAAWGVFAGALVPVLALGLNWKRATAGAANAAVITSLVLNLGLRFGDVTLPFGIDRGATALAVSLLVFIALSSASKPQALADDVEAVMDV